MNPDPLWQLPAYRAQLDAMSDILVDLAKLPACLASLVLDYSEAQFAEQMRPITLSLYGMRLRWLGGAMGRFRNDLTVSGWRDIIYWMKLSKWEIQPFDHLVNRDARAFIEILKLMNIVSGSDHILQSRNDALYRFVLIMAKNE